MKNILMADLGWGFSPPLFFVKTLLTYIDNHRDFMLHTSQAAFIWSPLASASLCLKKTAFSTGM